MFSTDRRRLVEVFAEGEFAADVAVVCASRALTHTQKPTSLEREAICTNYGLAGDASDIAGVMGVVLQHGNSPLH